MIMYLLVLYPMLFIFYYLYINKVCDVWDNHNPNILEA